MAAKSFDIVKLSFTSPLHLSRGKTDYYDRSETVLHSDTIKSVIFIGAKQLYREIINRDFLESFLISSAYFFNRDEYFLPKPLVNFNINIQNIEEGPAKYKRIKRLKYLSKAYFEKVMNDVDIGIENDQFSSNGSLLSIHRNPETFYSSVLQQRVAKPSGEGEQPRPYYVDRLFFKKDAGMYFLVETENNDTKQMIKNGLKLMESEGLGTDRNVGNGQFQMEYIDKGFEVELPEKADASTLLSLYLPKQEEIKESTLNKSSYQLLKRGGYISNAEDLQFVTFRKKSIYMFAEGSVIGTKNIKGNIADLKPETVQGLNHPVYRDGQALAIPIRLPGA
ncbi:MAG: type III-A CRISPR-associated RAMP protein Csm4 [Bacteroidales bacterium]|nr:type III-A CRISPR-associated RAMP protein Csm4 [Bacteroidales bacterium]MCF8387701.1 type III-A CRISPR-associated RAMP protein Csm4 [Bacteroidales bacterium]MCF8398515.1 type III-A CRISPR-associated RAMP protein Csm4 [Bacteroidales bacterium]